MPKFFTSVKKDCVKISDFISRLLAVLFKNTETRAFCGAEIRDMSLCVAESVSCLPVFGFRDKDTMFVSKPHLKPVVTNTQSVTVVRTTEFNNMPMLQRVGTSTQNDKFSFDSYSHFLREAQDRLLSRWMLQDDEHENYRALRLLAPVNGIHELALSASRIRRSSLATSSDVESSKKSIKSSNIFLDMTEDGATIPRIFSSLMMVMDDLFMSDSVAQGVVKANALNRNPAVGRGFLQEARVLPKISWLQRVALAEFKNPEI